MPIQGRTGGWYGKIGLEKYPCYCGYGFIENSPNHWMCMLVWFPVKARHDERLYTRTHQKNKSNCDLKRNKSNGKITVGLVSEVLRTTILWEHLSTWSSSAWEDAGSWTWQLRATNQQLSIFYSVLYTCVNVKSTHHVNEPQHDAQHPCVFAALERWCFIFIFP